MSELAKVRNKSEVGALVEQEFHRAASARPPFRGFGEGTVAKICIDTTSSILLANLNTICSSLKDFCNRTRISAADMFVDSTLRYGNEVQMTVTEDRKI
jgi:hypothetical protein